MAEESPVEQHKVSLSGASRTSLTEWAQQYSVEATPLGRGSFASVYKGVNTKTGEPVAIKVMTKTRLGEKALQMLAAEINILRRLEHPNVVCLRDSHTTERRILIVLEFCGGGDLGQFIQARGPSPESTARHFMLQLAAGLAFLRSKRLIHRDIKPQNLLLSEESPRALLKIADFGLARHLPQGSLAESMLGSPLYMAPEVLSNRAYDAKADLWSAGAVLYELLTAKHPFVGANQTELITNIRRNRPRLPPGVTLSPECLELLGMLLVPRPSERASLEAFLKSKFLNPVASAAGGPGSRGQTPDTGVRNSGEEQPTSPASLSSPHHQAPHTKECYGNPPRIMEPEHERRSDKMRVAAAAAASASTGRDGDEHPRTVISRARIEKNAEDDEPGAIGGAIEDNIERHRGDRNGNGEWGWDWSAKGAAGDGDGGREGCAIIEEGPLPALPSLPSTLGPLAAARSGGDVEPRENGGGGGGSGARLSPDLAFDLAFVASNHVDHVEDYAEPSHVRLRGGGSSTDHVSPSGTPAVKAFDVDRSRRKDSSTDAAVTSAAADAVAKASAAVAAAPAFVSPARRRARSRSFSGRDAPTGAERTERVNTFSTSPYRGKTPVQRRRSGSGSGYGSVNGSGGGIGPEPVYYLGKEGSVPGPSLALPDHPRHSATLARRASSERTGFSTPNSSLYYSGDSGDGGGCAAADGRILHTSLSPSEARSRGGGSHTPVTREHSLPPDSDERALGGPPPALEDGSYQPQLQSATGLVGGNGSGSGSSAMAAPDGGVPMLSTRYPSLRGGDSLLTIPEDSTGFVLVTRPSSSISCEHEPGCECWAWNGGGGTGGGGGGIATMRSPSASYLAAANPYGGPGKAGRAPGAGGAVAERRSGPVAFLGSVGNIWNTAMNTFRGVAGAQGRRPSWPATRAGRSSQQQQPKQRGSFPSSSQKPAAPAAAAAIPGGISVTTTAGGARSAGASPLASPREHMSPVSSQYRMMGEAGSSNGNSSNSSAGVGNSGSRGSGGDRGNRGISSGNNSKNALSYQQSAPPSGDKNDRRPEALYYCGGFSPPPRNRDADPRRLSHHRWHSEPIAPSRFPAGKGEKGNGGGSGGGMYTGMDGNDTVGGGRARSFDPQFEDSDSRRVRLAAERAEVVGKRSILVVILADKTAQGAMSLALESPRDARAVAPPAPWPAPMLRAGVELGRRTKGKFDKSAKGEVAYARRRHGMLTEALSLYVRALAILQGALPGVLVECEGVSTEGLAAWNPLSTEPNQANKHRFNRSPQLPLPKQQQQQQQREGRPSPPSPSLLTQRSALVTKASWLKDLFSQTLQRAEHCREQAAAAAAEAAAATTSTHTDARTPSDNAADHTAGDHTVAVDTAAEPLASASAVVTPFPKESSGLTPPSDTAAAAVFRSAMEHGQEAAVCYLLGQSDAAVTHYVRACALLHLLALEPEMSGVREKALHGDNRSPRSQHQVQEQQKSGSWQEQLLLIAEGYARRVEAISRGERKKGEQEGAVGGLEGGMEDGAGAGGATMPHEFMLTSASN